MQDNRNANMEEQMADRGWEAMRLLLDKEMPVAAPAEKRRPIVLFWLAAASLAGIGLFTALWGLKYSGHESPMAAFEQQVNPGVGYSDQKVNCQEGITTDIARVEKVDATTSIDDEATYEAIRLLPSLFSIKPIHIQQNNTPQLQTPNLENSGFTKEQPSFATKETVEISATASAGRDQNIVDYLQQPIGVLDVPTAALDKLPSKIKTPSPWMPSSLGMDLSMLSGNLTGIDGFAVGVRANYPIGRNLAIETGSSYRFQRQAIDINFNPNAFAPSDSYDAYTIVSNQLDVNTVAESIQPISNNQSDYASLSTVIKGHFIDVPVVLAYQLSPRWKLEAGPQFSYLAGAYQGSRSNAANEDSLGGSFAGESRKAGSNWYSLSSEQRLESFYFNRLDVGFSGGISYRPAQWLGLRAQVHQGLVDMIKSPNYHLRNQYFGLSTLVYF